MTNMEMAVHEAGVAGMYGPSFGLSMPDYLDANKFNGSSADRRRRR